MTKDLSTKQVLLIDLAKQTSSVKNVPGLDRYIGGVGVGLRLLHDYYSQNPLIFSIGPLNGFFPFCSKTCIVLDDHGVPEDLYLGGSLSTRLAFSGIDAVVLLGRADEPMIVDVHNSEVTFRQSTEDISSFGLPGKRSILTWVDNKYLLDNYFSTSGNLVTEKLQTKNVTGLVVTGSETISVAKVNEYTNLYNALLAKANSLSVVKDNFPSCSGCPMGCAPSKEGELGGNVIVHSLVACQFAESLFSDIGVIYACLNVLGYHYKHEDIESLPKLIENTLRGLS